VVVAVTTGAGEVEAARGGVAAAAATTGDLGTSCS
jgi:hypothetical protein